MSDLADLKAKAQAVQQCSPTPWRRSNEFPDIVEDANGDVVADYHHRPLPHIARLNTELALAANPAAILALIEQCEVAEKALEIAGEFLAQAAVHECPGSYFVDVPGIDGCVQGMTTIPDMERDCPPHENAEGCWPKHFAAAARRELGLPEAPAALK